MSDYTYVDFASSTLHILAVQNGVNVETYGQSRDVFVAADRVEEVCAALRAAAGLPPVWTVEKQPFTDKDLTLRSDGAVRINAALAGLDDVVEVRTFAAQLLAAADEVEARANRPKLPTAYNSVVHARGSAYTRMGDGCWMRAGSAGHCNDEWFQDAAFTVLYDPEKAT